MGFGKMNNNSGGGGFFGGGAKSSGTSGGGLFGGGNKSDSGGGGLFGGGGKGGGLFGGGGKGGKGDKDAKGGKGGFNLFNKKGGGNSLSNKDDSESLPKDSKELAAHLHADKKGGKEDTKVKSRFDRDVLKAKKKAKQDKTEAFNRSFSFNGLTLYDEFLPFASFYDKETIITKNGDVLQTIAIPIFSRVEGKNNLNVMRTYLRKALRKVVTNPRVGVWIHTLRNKTNLLDTNAIYNNVVCDTINQLWNDSNEFSDQFVNEVYITFVYQSVEEKLMHPTMILGSLASFIMRPIFLRAMRQGSKILKKLVKAFLEEIRLLKPYQLTIKQDEQGHYYSEILSLFSNIVNLEPRREYIHLGDLSEQIADQCMRFVNNYFYVIKNNPDDAVEQKKYACVLSAKNSPYIKSEQLDSLLQLPFHFIVSQSIDFADRTYLTNKYTKQRFYQEISKDDDFFSGCGISDIFDTKPEVDTTNNMTEEAYDPNNRFCFTQINFTIMGDSKEELEDHVSQLVKQAENMGLVLFREDIMQELSFWAQFPGNFSETRRQFDLLTLQAGEFAATFSVPFGQYENNAWGRPIALFKSILDTPYFFSFHGSYSYGNTLIVGSDLYSYKSLIANFLLAEAYKCDGQVFYVDKNYNAEILVHALKGDYLYFTPQDPEKFPQETQKFLLQVNPFTLPNTPENQEFIAEWLVALASYDFDPERLVYDDEVKELHREFALVPEIAKQIMELASTKNIILQEAIEQFNTQTTPQIYQKLQFWLSDKNPYLEQMNTEEDNLLDTYNNITAVNLSREFVQLPYLIKPMLLYIMHKISVKLEPDKPNIVVLNGILHLVNKTDMSTKFLAWATKLEKRNCVLINLSENFDSYDEQVAEFINKHTTTSLFLSHRKMLETKFNEKLFHVDAKQVSKLRYQGKRNNCFIVRQVGRGETIIDFPSQKLGQHAKILQPDKKARAAFAEIFYHQLHSEAEPEVLLPMLVDAFEKDDTN